jgi:predicted Zn-dependent protease with MMP-like domain
MAGVRRPPRGGRPQDTPLRRRLAKLREGRGDFEQLVAEAVRLLPPRFRSHLSNVEVVVEEEPTPDDLAQAGIEPDGTLLGLYRGVPQSQRSVMYGSVLPDQIVIYRKPLCEMARDRRELITEVRITLMHEIGHHFGMDEEELREAGYE